MYKKRNSLDTKVICPFQHSYFPTHKITPPSSKVGENRQDIILPDDKAVKTIDNCQENSSVKW